MDAETTSAQQQYPNLNPYVNSNGNSTQSAAQSAQASVQSGMDSLKNGPMADKARLETDKTTSQLSNLAASRQTPSSQTATGQNLTHYHSFFYNLLSWENPRATAISYASIVFFIFATRYLPLVRLSLKGLYTVLGVTAAAEVAGKTILGQGFASKMRPKQYYVLPQGWLESIMEDVTELINFFVIEFQRIVFAENVGVTIGAFAATLITYFLIKITPAWGLALLFTTVTYFTPLIYIQNKDLIDHHVNNASEIVSQQTSQVRELAGQHTSKASEMASGAFRDYSAKASEMMGGAKKTAVEKGVISEETAAKAPGGAVNNQDFPAAPSSEPIAKHDGAFDAEHTSASQGTYGERQEQEPLLS